MKVICLIGLFALFLIIDFSVLVGGEVSGSMITYISVNTCYAGKLNCFPCVRRSNYRAEKTRIRDLSAQVAELEKSLTAQVAEGLREFGAESYLYQQKLTEGQGRLGRVSTVNKPKPVQPLVRGQNNNFGFTLPSGNRKLNPSGSQFKPVIPVKGARNFRADAKGERLTPSAHSHNHYGNRPVSGAAKLVGNGSYDDPRGSRYWSNVTRSGSEASMGVSDIALEPARSRKPYAPATVLRYGSLFSACQKTHE